MASIDQTKSQGKIGIFGGSFNPFHVGHLNSALTVAEKVNLKKVFVVPSAQSPHKQPIEGPTAEQRCEMVRLGIQGYDDVLSVDEQELSRGGVSFTIDTLRNYLKTYKPEDLYLIIGVDVFYNFGDWKSPEEILESVNLVVTSRPGHHFPYTLEEMPELLQPLVEEFRHDVVTLNSGRTIEFVTLQDINASATDIRKRVRAGYPTDKFLLPSVSDYIKDNKIYGTLERRISDFEQFTRLCGDILFSKKAIGVRGFDLKDLNAPTEFSLIASGTSTRHTSSLGESVMKQVKEEIGVYPLSVEGLGEGRWVLLDYGSLIIHIFYDFVRQEYRLEDLWRKARDLNLKDPSLGAKADLNGSPSQSWNS